MTDTLASLRDQVDHLRYAAAEMTAVPAEQEWLDLGLTRCEGRLVGALVQARGVAITTAGLVAAMHYSAPECDWPHPNEVKVVVSRVRRKLREAGIPGEIRTVWGVGYRWVA